MKCQKKSEYPTDMKIMLDKEIFHQVQSLPI